MPRLTAIGFDADDTLWHNERFFQLTQERFVDLLKIYTERNHLAERLEAAERRNIVLYGFGIKGFILSMIETALEVTENRVPGTIISELISVGQEMLAHPIELLPHAREAVETLAPDHTLILITKGDLLDQERKLAQSGLGELFDAVEIVSEKTPETYLSAFNRHGTGPTEALMAGNSMKSDILPALKAGAHAAFIPHDLSWSLEHAEPPVNHPCYHALPDLGALPDLVASVAG